MTPEGYAGMTPTANGEMIQLARESRGLTQKNLAQRAGISQGNVSKFERGELVPSATQLENLASILDYPLSFFLRTNSVFGFGISMVFHRRRKSLAAIKLRKIQAEVNIRTMEIEKLLAGVEVESKNEFCELDIDEFGGDAEYVADLVRAKWQLPLGPVKSVVGAIESAGGLVVKCDFGTQKLDAVSHWGTGLPPIFFVNGSIPADRLRFTLAHEIGHIVMHRIPTSNMEDEADRFASSFLLPRNEILPELSLFSLERAMRLKRVWKVSIAALVLRAYDLGVVPDWKKRKFFMELAAAGYRTREPVELEDEEPATVRKLIHTYRNHIGYTTQDLANMLSLKEREFCSSYLGASLQMRRFPSLFENDQT